MLRKLLIPLTLCAASIAAAPVAAAELTVVGSNTLEPFVAQWAQLYKAKSPAVPVTISSPGTSVAPKALLAGKADLAAMNREMTNDESEAFLRAQGYYPTAIAVAIEAAALYVNPANPLSGLDYSQLDAIFSGSHGCGWSAAITKWGQLGATGPWADQAIVLFGHDKNSALRDFFDKSVLCRDEFRQGIEELPHQQLLSKIAENKYALGYSRYQPDSKLKVLQLKKSGGDFVALTLANLHNRSYRLQHYLYLYLDRPAGKAVPAEVLEFLKIGLSKEGQAAVEAAGYVALPDELIQRQLAKLK